MNLAIMHPGVEWWHIGFGVVCAAYRNGAAYGAEGREVWSWWNEFECGGLWLSVVECGPL